MGTLLTVPAQLPARGKLCGWPVPHISLQSPRQAPDAYSGLDNVTLLEETVAAVSDAMLVTSPSDYPEAIAVSLASDPGALLSLYSK